MLAAVRQTLKVGARLATPVTAACYRANPKMAPDWLLTALNIANTSHRPSFRALKRIAATIDPFDGDVVECGVYKGATLLGVAHELAKRDLRHVRIWGMDSFEGLPAPTTEDAVTGGAFHESAKKGYFSDTSREAVWQRVVSCGYGNQVQLVKGFFDATLPTLADRRFSLVHIDCDLYQPYKDCLEFLYPRTNAGGYIVFDEYDYSAAAYPGAQKAIDEFFADKPERIECFPGDPAPRYFVRKT